MLGVPGYARGGRIGGGGEGFRFREYDAGDTESSKSVEVNNDIKVELHIHTDGTGNIVEAVKAQMGEIADAVAGEIAAKLGTIFENTPARGGA